MTSAEILAELRAARPVASAPLRARVEAIATAEQHVPSTSWLRRRRIRVWAAIPAAAVLAVASAGAIGLVRGGERGVAVTATSADAPATESTRSTAPAPVAGAGSADAAAPGPTGDRAQRVSATMTVRVADTDALSRSTQEALDVTRSLGGYVVSVSYATADDGSAALVLRVPTESVQEAITRLASLGTIVSQQVQIDDLQEQIDTLGRRVVALRSSIARLTAQLAEPGLSPAQRASLTARRAAARDELAAVTADRAARRSEARLATVQLTLVTEQGAVVPPVPSRIDRALDEAGGILAWEAAIVVYVLVLVGPLALLVAGGWLGRRAVSRRADERLLGAP